MYSNYIYPNQSLPLCQRTLSVESNGSPQTHSGTRLTQLVPENSEADRIHLGPDSCLPSPQSELWEFSYKRDILEVSQSMH